MKRPGLSLLLLVFVCRVLPAQTPVSSERGFIEYLVGNNMADDAAIYLDSKQFCPSDTLDFLRGWSNYCANRLEKAADFFTCVGPSSPFYEKSVFSLAVCNAYAGKYDPAVLSAYNGPLQELKSFELAGLALLRDDPEAFKAASSDFSYSVFNLAEGEKTFDEIYKSRYLTSRKSPLLSAAMSAVVPGLGKIYAGRPDEGIMSFISVGCCAAITAENWSRYGPGNWKTILFGVLGSIFYIGNIYGSYVSVGIVNQRIENEQKAAVMYSIHIPIRSFYN